METLVYALSVLVWSLSRRLAFLIFVIFIQLADKLLQDAIK